MELKAYSYVRWSHKSQALTDSLRRQVALAQAWADRQGLQLASVRDEGVSAYRGPRGKLADFLAAVRDKVIPPGSVLVVESLDRLTRGKSWDAISLLGDILRAGIKVVTLTPAREYTDEDEDDMLKLLEAIMVLARGHDESRSKSVRVRAAWEEKKRMAISGTVVSTKVPLWLEVKGVRRTVGRSVYSNAKIVPIPDRCDLVRWMFERSSGGVGSFAMARELNRTGVKTWGRGQLWQKSYIERILNNRAVLGVYEPGSLSEDGRVVHQPILDYYPAIVSEQLWFQVHSSRRARKLPSGRPRGGRRTIDNLFQGFAFRGRSKNEDEGAPLVPMHYRAHNRSKGWVYLVSADSLAGATERKPIRWRYDVAERVVLKCLRMLRPDELMSKGSSDVMKAIVAEEDQAKHRVESLKLSISNLVEVLEQSTRDIMSVSKRLVELESDLGKARESLSEVQSRLASVVPSMKVDDSLKDLHSVDRAVLRATFIRLGIRLYFRERSIEVSLKFGSVTSIWLDAEGDFVGGDVDVGGYDPSSGQTIGEWSETAQNEMEAEILAAQWYFDRANKPES